MMKQSTTVVMLVIILAALSISLVASLNLSKPVANSSVDAVKYAYTVVRIYPHDTGAFTEGLVYSHDSLYESTGLYGNSSLRHVELATGNVTQEVTLPNGYFGEGIAVVNDTIIQLTWQSHVGFIYDKATFTLLGDFTYPTEGWGLTFDGGRLILSDGSDTLYFLDPTTFERVGQVQVHDGNMSVADINELEYINGDIYANIWKQQQIAVINPETGQVKAWIDLTGLQGSANLNYEDVLNGIAYDAAGDRLFVTGKDWPYLYEVKLVPQS